MTLLRGELSREHSMHPHICSPAVVKAQLTQQGLAVTWKPGQASDVLAWAVLIPRPSLHHDGAADVWEMPSSATAGPQLAQHSDREAITTWATEWAWLALVVCQLQSTRQVMLKMMVPGSTMTGGMGQATQRRKQSLLLL